MKIQWDYWTLYTRVGKIEFKNDTMLIYNNGKKNIELNEVFIDYNSWPIEAGIEVDKEKNPKLGSSISNSWIFDKEWTIDFTIYECKNDPMEVLQAIQQQLVNNWENFNNDSNLSEDVYLEFNYIKREHELLENKYNNKKPRMKVLPLKLTYDQKKYPKVLSFSIKFFAPVNAVYNEDISLKYGRGSDITSVFTEFKTMPGNFIETPKPVAVSDAVNGDYVIGPSSYTLDQNGADTGWTKIKNITPPLDKRADLVPISYAEGNGIIIPFFSDELIEETNEAHFIYYDNTKIPIPKEMFDQFMYIRSGSWTDTKNIFKVPNMIKQSNIINNKMYLSMGFANWVNNDLTNNLHILTYAFDLTTKLWSKVDNLSGVMKDTDGAYKENLEPGGLHGGSAKGMVLARAYASNVISYQGKLEMLLVVKYCSTSPDTVPGFWSVAYRLDDASPFTASQLTACYVASISSGYSLTGWEPARGQFCSINPDNHDEILMSICEVVHKNPNDNFNNRDMPSYWFMKINPSPGVKQAFTFHSSNDPNRQNFLEGFNYAYLSSVDWTNHNIYMIVASGGQYIWNTILRPDYSVKFPNGAFLLSPPAKAEPVFLNNQSVQIKFTYRFYKQPFIGSMNILNDKLNSLFSYKNVQPIPISHKDTAISGSMTTSFNVNGEIRAPFKIVISAVNTQTEGLAKIKINDKVIVLQRLAKLRDLLQHGNKLEIYSTFPEEVNMRFTFEDTPIDGAYFVKGDLVDDMFLRPLTHYDLKIDWIDTTIQYTPLYYPV